MAAPITDTERATIIELLGEGHTRNEVAKRSGKAPSTVTKIAREIGHNFLAQADAATQSSLARAHEARSAYSAERRAEIAARATERAEEALAKMSGTYLAFNFGGKDNTYTEHELDAPPVEAQRAMAQTFRDLMRTVLDIDRHDRRDDGDLAAVDRWLRDVVGSSG